MADSHEIYNLGRLCEGAFHDLLSDRSLASFPIVDVLYQHFQQWASYLGVFAEESISLDSRLRTSDSLRTLVLQLLEITKRNLIRTMAIENEKTGSKSPASLIESMDRRTSENVSSPLVETLQALEAALDSLHRLGVAMRQTSSSNLTQRIVAFIDKEDDGDLQDLICFRLKHKLMASARNQGKDTGPPLSLCKQLAVSISFRYFRIRRHVDEDLKLYACISEQCLEPPQLFSRFDDWCRHMDQVHSPRWAETVHGIPFWCCDTNHEVLNFDDEAAFDRHVMEQHPEYDTQSDITLLKEWCRIRRDRPPYTCPICGCVPREIALIAPWLVEEDSFNELPKRKAKRPVQIRGDLDADFRRKLSLHVACHIKELGFMSIIYLDDGSDDGSGAGQRPSTLLDEEWGFPPSPSDLQDLDPDFEGYNESFIPKPLDENIFELDWARVMTLRPSEPIKPPDQIPSENEDSLQEKPAENALDFPSKSVEDAKQSSHSRRKGKGRKHQIWSAWGEWIWSKTYSRYYRQRQDNLGNIETAWGPEEPDVRGEHGEPDEVHSDQPSTLRSDDEGDTATYEGYASVAEHPHIAGPPNKDPEILDPIGSVLDEDFELMYDSVDADWEQRTFRKRRRPGPEVQEGKAEGR
ncbi:hypothetical protein SAPIO_CDS4926 [Scedosporium apiospermum]|uniref:Uncharacterized protein n=1 Tax=Pseudallescheria apiosperma TaxID=563466 RepID=A0A084G7C5_PSEDA|nr:uncharacterized protein SAPIO_CDS4926 [Scedosporium apiospermum]KEZ43237.1 hypothetical protein SAPIO_CDS4926 [Scedosporium apiospermum]